MKKVAIKLHDYLSGKCIYKGCKNNTYGICTSNEYEHLSYIAKIVKVSLNKDTSVLKNTDIVCDEVDVEEGHCKFCGHKLIAHTDYESYGDATVPRTTYECQNPKC